MSLTKEQYDQVYEQLYKYGVNLYCPFHHGLKSSQYSISPYEEGMKMVKCQCRICGHTQFFDPKFILSIL